MDKRKIFLLSLGHLSCDINGGAVPALLPFLVAAYHFDYQSAAGLVFAHGCFASIVQPLFGYASDRLSKPFLIPLGVLVAGASLGLIAFLNTYWAIFFAIMASGMGAALFHPEAARLANKVSGSHKGEGISLFAVGGNAGHALGPLLVAACVGAFGLAGTALFGVVALITASVLLYLLIHAGRAAPGQAVTAASTATGELPRNDWKAFGVLTGAIISRAVVFLGFSTFIPLYWTHVLGQSETAGAFALTFFSLCGVLSNFVGGMLGDRFGYVRMMLVCYVLVVPFMLLFPQVENRWLCLLLLAPTAFALYAPFSSVVVLGQKYLARNIGFASGVTLGLAVSVGGIASPLLGRLADSHGLPWTLRCLGGVALIGLIFVLWLRERQPLSATINPVSRKD